MREKFLIGTKNSKRTKTKLWIFNLSLLKKKQEAHGPHGLPKKTVQINKLVEIGPLVLEKKIFF